METSPVVVAGEQIPRCPFGGWDQCISVVTRGDLGNGSHFVIEPKCFDSSQCLNIDSGIFGARRQEDCL